MARVQRQVEAGRHATLTAQVNVCFYGFIRNMRNMCSLINSFPYSIFIQCVVAVSKGDKLLSPKAIQEAQMLKKNPLVGWRMACARQLWGLEL